MILLTLDFTHLTNYKLLIIQTFTFIMTQKKITPKKVPKRAQRVERVERSSAKNIKNVPDRLLIMMKKKVTKEIKKRGEATEISWPIPHKKLRRRNEKRLKGRFSSKSVDFFTNIFTNRNNDSQSPRLPRKESRR